MKRSYSIYCDAELIEKFTAGIELEESEGKRIVKAIERCLSGEKVIPIVESKECPLSEATIGRLQKLFEYRKSLGKHSECEDLDCFVNEILDHLREDIFFISPKEF